MNRRELLQAATSLLTTAGLPGEVKIVDVEPRPLLLTITPHKPISVQQKETIREEFRRLHTGCNFPQVVILPVGMTLEAVLDPRG